MQKLLGRAFEARGSCNCAICLPIGPGLARNANNTLPAQKRLKFGDVVNVVYGTIIGTAALYDGTVKNNRRRAVDNALLGLLQENEAVLQNQEARLRALGYEGSESEASLFQDVTRRSEDTNLLSWNTITKRPSLLKPTSRHLRHYSIRYLDHQDGRLWQTEMETRQQDRVLNRLQTSSEPEKNASNMLRQTQDKDDVSLDSILQPEARFVGKSMEKAWEDLTLIPHQYAWQIRETAVAQLVLKLLKTHLTSINTGRDKATEIRLKRDGRPDSTFRPEDVPRMMQLHTILTQRIEDLKLEREVPDLAELIEHVQFPRFSNYRRHEGIESFYHSDIRELHDGIAGIFVQAADSADLISRLCSLLLSSPVGPNIHTMNLLLLLFLDIQWYQACKAVIHALSVMTLNQNEITDAAKLQFYHLTQQDMNFDTQRACMLGIDGRVTRAAFQPGKLTTEVYHLEQVVAKLKFRNGKPKWIRGLKAGWTAEAFSIVIIDLLDRGELQQALAEIATMKLSGFQETPHVLEALLQYSVFKQDWNLALETWARFDDPNQKRSVLTWYWMLQACASCQQSDKFYHFAAAGQQLGILDPSIKYLMESFELPSFDQARLKLKVQALRRLRYRVPIPQLPQRDLLVQEDEIIQLPNLQKTMLMVYLQYAKLRNITYTWFVDHLGYLQDAEAQLEHIVLAPSATPELLQHIKAKWTTYIAKVEAFESKHHGLSRINNTKRAAVGEQAAPGDGCKNISGAIPPPRWAGSRALLMYLGYHRLTARPKAILLEIPDYPVPGQIKPRHTWSLQSSGASHTVKTLTTHATDHGWRYIQRHDVTTEADPAPVRYMTISNHSVPLRKVFAKGHVLAPVAVESSLDKDDVVEVKPSATEIDVTWKVRREYVVPRPTSAPPRVYPQHDIEPDEVFEQDLRLVAAY